MQYFIYLLTLVWTLLFGVIFFKLFPDATDRITHKREYIDPGDREYPPSYMKNTLPPCDPKQGNNPVMGEEDTPVPLNKDDPSVDIKIQGNEPELPTAIITKEELDNKLSSALENRLIQIIVKINLAACPTCTPDDKRVVLQLKMMNAFLSGKPKEASKYSEELDKYVKAKKDLKKKKPPVKEIL